MKKRAWARTGVLNTECIIKSKFKNQVPAHFKQPWFKLYVGFSVVCLQTTDIHTSEVKRGVHVT